MVNQQVIKEYSYSMAMLKKQCCDAGMSEAEFKKIYYEALEELEKEKNETPRRSSNNIKLKFAFLTLVLALSTIVLYNFNIILSNMQEFIYPGLYTLRKLAIPFISLFPSLTGE